MNIKRIRLPIIILAIGIILSIVSHFIVSPIKAPTVKEQDFSYSVTYELDGVQKTFEGIYRCTFDGSGDSYDPSGRYYLGEYVNLGLAEHSDAYTIAQKDGFDLAVTVRFNESYLMGDTQNEEYDEFQSEPYLVVFDADGVAYSEESFLNKFDAKIVSWVKPEPIENTFVFAGFASFNVFSMMAMLAVGLLTVVACALFVKKDEEISYTSLDRVSLMFNLIIGLLALPFMTVVAFFLPLTMSSADPLYITFLIVPIFTVFTLAASVALRRKGFSKTGFFSQFIGPAFYFLCTLVVSIISGLF